MTSDGSTQGRSKDGMGKHWIACKENTTTQAPE